MTLAIQLAVDEANDSFGARSARLQAWVLDDNGVEEQGVKVRSLRAWWPFEAESSFPSKTAR
jgi:hypothetical protein